MSLLKMKLKAAVLAGIAGVLVFAGGAFATIAIGTQPTGPTGDFVYGATNHALTVSATATGSMSYQWYSTAATTATNGTAITGATSTTYSVSSLQKPGTYKYYVVVSSDNSGETPLASNLVTIVLKKATLTEANLSTYIETFDLTTAVGNVASGAGFAPADIDAKVTSVGPPKVTMQPVGAVTVQYRPTGTTSNWASAAPLRFGQYDVCLTLAGTDYYEAATTGNTPFVYSTKLTVDPVTLRPAEVNKSDTTVTFSATGKYTITGPKLWSTDDYTVDSIGYDVDNIDHTVLTGTGGSDLAATKFNVAKAKSADATYAFTLEIDVGDVAVGDVKIPFTVYAKEKAGLKRDFQATGLNQTIKISQNTITDAMVSVRTGAPFVYTGANTTADELNSRVQVKDGTRILTECGDYDDATTVNDYSVNFTKGDGTVGTNGKVDGAISGLSAANRKDAGTAYVFVEGHGNYTGVAKTTYIIAKKPVTVSITDVQSKVYDGSKAVDTVSATPVPASVSPEQAHGNIKVTFYGLITGESFDNVRDYLISNAQFDVTDVTPAGSVTASATVSLQANGSVSKNYSLASGAVTYALGVGITQRTPISLHATNAPVGDTCTFSFKIPTDHYFKGAIQAGVGSVTLRSPMTNTGSTLKVLYRYDAGQWYFRSNTDSVQVATGETKDTTYIPKHAGDYKVFVRIDGTGKNVLPGTTLYELGTYSILPAAAPTVVLNEGASISVKQNRNPVMSVTATSPNGGQLSYQWFSYSSGTSDDPVRIAGATSASFTAPSGASGTYAYYACRVTNSRPGVQVDVSAYSDRITVSFGEPATMLTGRTVVTLAKDTLTYTGFGITPTGSDLVVRYFTVNPDDATDTTWKDLTAGTDYTVTYARNTNVGRADIIVVGANDYDGSVTKNFTIVKKELDFFDLTFVESRPYDGTDSSANVRLMEPRTGAGALTVKYNGSTTKPTLPDIYVLEVTAAEGTNYKASPEPGFWVGIYEISKGKLDSSCFAYTIPTNHVEGVAGTAYGIGNVTFKKGTGYGTMKVMYGTSGDTVVPKTAGTYLVTVGISGGDYYDQGIAVLGNYTIKSTPDAVKAANRDVPNSGKVEVAAIAPVKVVASGFTAGPSPVRNGEVIKFFSRSNVKSGSLYIFDQSGNSVAKVKASGSGEIGSWKVSTASAGSYVVKGVLIGKDGTKEKVSFVFAVTK